MYEGRARHVDIPSMGVSAIQLQPGWTVVIWKGRGAEGEGAVSRTRSHGLVTPCPPTCAQEVILLQ